VCSSVVPVLHHSHAHIIDHIHMLIVMHHTDASSSVAQLLLNQPIFWVPRVPYISFRKRFGIAGAVFLTGYRSNVFHDITIEI